MKVSRMLATVGVLLPLLLFVFPLWNIVLEAPQYPIPLGMNIYIHDFSDVNPHDIKNINLMNHYVGMKYIPEVIPEFRIFPIVVITMTVLGLLMVFKANYKWYLPWLILMLLLGAIGMYDFYLWEYDYGHNLNPKAIMKFTNPDGSVLGFQPPLFGSKQLLNFRVHSYPHLGAYSLVIGMFMVFLSFLINRRAIKKTHKK